MVQIQAFFAEIGALFVNLFDRPDWRNIVDIGILAVLIYSVIKLVMHTRANSLFKGILFILVLSWLANALEISAVSWLLQQVINTGVLVLVIVFQPELRRALERLGQNTNWAGMFNLRRSDPSLRGVWQNAVVAICDAAEQLSDTRTGALMVFERNNNLDEIIRTGTPLSANVIPEMLGTIFYEGTPLHDGAVIIRDGRIVAAGCVLPLSNNLEMGKDMGTRHRAGLGMSENSDAIVVVVSEETGIISMAKKGVLIRRLDRQNLFNLLQEEIIPPEDEAEQKKEAPWVKWFKKGGDGKHAAEQKA